MGGELELTAVHVLEAVLVEVSGVEVGTTWPCPSCGERRSVATSASARIRNRVAPSLERWIRLCETCVSPYLGMAASAEVPPPESDPALEPWLTDLAGSTAVRRLMRSVEGVIHREAKQIQEPPALG